MILLTTHRRKVFFEIGVPKKQAKFHLKKFIFSKSVG